VLLLQLLRFAIVLMFDRLSSLQFVGRSRSIVPTSLRFVGRSRDLDCVQQFKLPYGNINDNPIAFVLSQST
jgi:hypothetical protein